MNTRYLVLGTAFAAALTLAACGGDDDEEPVDETPAAAVTPEPDPPGIADGAAATNIALDDIVGVWAETLDQCGTADELIIAPDAFAVGEEACIVTGVDTVDGGLSIQLICPLEDAAPGTITWTIAAFGEAPYTEITITDDGATTAFVSCLAGE